MDPDDTRRRRPRAQVPGQLSIFEVLALIEREPDEAEPTTQEVAAATGEEQQ